MNRALYGFPKRTGADLPQALVEIPGDPYITATSTRVEAPVQSGLGRWFRADSGLTTSSSRVSQWDDLTGSGNNATQATAGNQPLLVDGVLDNRPVVRFVASRPDHLGVDLSLLANSDYTITLVVSRSATGNKYCMGAITSGTSNQSLHVGWQAATNWRCGHWGSDVDATVPDFASGTFYTFTMIKRGGAGRKTASMQQTLTTSTNTSNLTGIAGGGTIGRAVGVNFDGDLAEILIYSRALSVAEQLQNEYYLRTRYPSLGALAEF